ncbi:Uncharacterized conserved protein YabE, contains G5 and tandem DUF348 domains [Halolactibacillus halophilus]|uniref:Uncharacterized conserved protein YabE, contains G5 and tandem DUF348 domains n=1 Tax=Halolactibacillus halophilus TaxID=306540 RepID=A0A1I5SIY6_9BACI|nr:G5 and 3D domain-containing protein [Halolactibacillus halophilus]GEM02575.1 hypothetical protein HHA03_21070 [Halolactibacillus halophilus]SFP70679.1 Uncharacterized conserved protein YabE, contains G5 and tandem DUF348 domains [Halolactibacillus halophilus]
MNLKSKLPTVFKHKVFMPVVTVLLLLVVVGFVGLEVTKKDIAFTHNGETQTVVTRAETVEALLEELEINPSEDDYLSHELTTNISSDMEVEYKEAVEVVVNDQANTTTYMTTASTVGEFLETENIQIASHDELSVASDEVITDTLTLDIDRAAKVSITDGTNETNAVYTTADTVEALLKEQQLELSDLDRVEPGIDKTVTADMTVDVIRVEEVTDVVEEEVAFSTVRKNDSSLTKGKEQVVTSGSNGLVEKRYTVVLENGEEVSRELVSEDVKKEAAQRVVAVGTKAIQQAPSRGTSSAVAGKTITVEATAYNWNCATCDGRGLTATGYNLKANPDGVIAVDPSVIPLGTKVYVEGYGYAVARDTGGAIKGNRIDVHLSSISAARQFGRQTVKVTIIE